MLQKNVRYGIILKVKNKQNVSYKEEQKRCRENDNIYNDLSININHICLSGLCNIANQIIWNKSKRLLDIH